MHTVLATGSKYSMCLVACNIYTSLYRAAPGVQRPLPWILHHEEFRLSERGAPVVKSKLYTDMCLFFGQAMSQWQHCEGFLCLGFLPVSQVRYVYSDTYLTDVATALMLLQQKK